MHVTNVYTRIGSASRASGARGLFLLLFSCAFAFTSIAQQRDSSTFWTPSETFNKKRFHTVVITEATLGTTALIGLDQLWYADYPRSSFHLINDNGDWLQMDKFGHAMTAYYIGVVGIDVMDWTGVDHKKAVWYGGLLGFTFLTSIEVLDGLSEEWGASPGDVLANSLGASLAIGQDLLWREQRIVMKYSFHQSRYADIRPDLLGDDFIESSLKDYNGQTYWLSANLASFVKHKKIPQWLNIAVGYGIDGVITGSPDDEHRQEFPSYQRQRQFYLSLDIDLRKIRTKSRFLNAAFRLVNFIKVPAPTIEFNEKGKVKVYPLYF